MVFCDVLEEWRGVGVLGLMLVGKFVVGTLLFGGFVLRSVGKVVLVRVVLRFVFVLAKGEVRRGAVM